MVQWNSAVRFSKYFSELCSEIHVYEVRRFKQADFKQENSVGRTSEKFIEITPTVRSEKVLSVTAPRIVHTAYHRGKKLRNTLEKVAPRSLSSGNSR